MASKGVLSFPVELTRGLHVFHFELTKSQDGGKCVLSLPVENKLDTQSLSCKEASVLDLN